MRLWNSLSVRLSIHLLILAALIGSGCTAAGAQGGPTAAVLTATPTALPTLTPTPAIEVSGLFVDAATEAGEISPLVYGTNYGPWLFVPLQMQPFAEEANLNIVRYPGGNWGDLNDMDEWNLDQFMAFCDQIGAEAYIHVRLNGGTAEKAAEMVRLLNVQKGYGIRFWSIGNEPNLFGDGYNTETYNRQWREWATAMEAVDPTIMLIGPEVNQFIANPDNEYELELERWMTEFLDANGDMVDIVSFHRYPFPASVSSGLPSIDELRASTAEWDIVIPYVRALVREHTGRDLPIAVTEANSSWASSSGGETTLDSHYNAIWWGDVLGRMIRQGVYMVNQFAIAGEFGLMGNYEVRPIYHVYTMYKNFGEESLVAASDNPMVSIFAARREDGALTLMIVNLASETKEIPLTIENWTGSTDAGALLFDKDHPAVKIDAFSLESLTTLQLTPESMLLLILPAN